MRVYDQNGKKETEQLPETETTTHKSRTDEN